MISLSVSPPIPSNSHAVDEEGTETENTLFATGSADGIVKVWDTKGGFVTHVFKGHGGGVSAVGWRFLEPLIGGEMDVDASNSNSRGGGFANDPRARGKSNGTGRGGKIMQLITGSVDARVRVFDLLDPSHRSSSSSSSSSGNGGKPEFILEGHVSVVRGISVNLASSNFDGMYEDTGNGNEEEQESGRWMITGGRDRVVLLWDFGSRLDGASSSGTLSAGPKSKSKKSDGKQAPKTVQTTLTNETIESVGFVDPSDLLPSSSGSEGKKRSLVAYTGGEKGCVRVWDVLRGKEIGKMDGPAGRGDEDDEDEGEKDDEDEDAEERGIREVL